MPEGPFPIEDLPIPALAADAGDALPSRLDDDLLASLLDADISEIEVEYGLDESPDRGHRLVMVDSSGRHFLAVGNTDRNPLDEVATQLPSPAYWDFDGRPAVVSVYGESEMTLVAWHQRGRFFNLQWYDSLEEGLAAAERAMGRVEVWP